MSENAEMAQWYVVHTYSGYENKVKANLEKSVENNEALQSLIQEISIPVEEVVEIRNGKRHTIQRKIFPGYVLVKMIMTDEAWYIVKNIRGVTGFVGSGTKPTPLTEEEVRQLGVEKHEIVVSYAEGDTVKVTDGPLTSFVGVVDMLDIEKNKVRVIVSMFGRETPVELELDQVEVVTP
jgi:transcription termination/antitermination protein NusG